MLSDHGCPRTALSCNQSLKWLELGQLRLEPSQLWFLCKDCISRNALTTLLTFVLCPTRSAALPYKERSFNIFAITAACAVSGTTESVQMEAPIQDTTVHLPETDLKGKKAPTGARARSIKTPLQREALEAAYLSEFTAVQQLL